MNTRFLVTRTALAAALLGPACWMSAWADDASVPLTPPRAAACDDGALLQAEARLQLHEETGNSEALAADRDAVDAARPRSGAACGEAAVEAAALVPASAAAPVPAEPAAVQAAGQRLQLHQETGNTEALAGDGAALAAARQEAGVQ
jgi:hypothetical protein